MKTQSDRARVMFVAGAALLVAGCGRTELEGEALIPRDGAAPDRPITVDTSTDRLGVDVEDVPLDRSEVADVFDASDAGDVDDADDAADADDVDDVVDADAAGDVGDAGDVVDVSDVADGGCAECPVGSQCCRDVCASVASDPLNCGGCGLICAAGDTCVGAVCRPPSACGPGGLCARGQLCCTDRCVGVLDDRLNCGTCGQRCLATQVCTAGRCEGLGCGGGGACPADASCCNDRCVDFRSDATNCGGCAIACRGGQECTAGRCTTPATGCGGGPACDAGLQCCGVFCIDVSGDPNHCGACARPCVVPAGTSASCRAGVCAVGACLPGFADCNATALDGCEVTTASDASNCGRCGLACAVGATCNDGVCGRPSSGSEGAFMPTVNPTYLRPGVHNFTTINVPAGVVVFVAGGGADNGTLDLRATSDVVVDGTIDVSGGPGSQSTITSRSTRQGRAGAGGFTGDPRTATPGPACEWVAGVSGGNGRGTAGTAGTCLVGSNTGCIVDNRTQLIFASPAAQFGGGGGVFTGYRAYGAGGGGFAGGGAGALGAAFAGQGDCNGVTAGGGASTGRGGVATGSDVYNGRDGVLGQTQCPATRPDIPASWVGGGGGGSIGSEAANDLAAERTFYPGSGGGGGSGDYLNRPAFGGTSGGGGGGGALRLWSETRITINGRLLANGGEGGDAYIGTNRAAGCDPQPGAAGGGGSGGLVFLRAPTLTVSGRGEVSAAGGAGGAGSLYATGGAGGIGGPGRIRLSVDQSRCRLDGRFAPSLTASCAPSAGNGVAGQVFVATYPR